MGTIIVGGALFTVVALIIVNVIRKIRRGGSVCCSGSDCACGCGCGIERKQPTQTSCCSGGADCHCHTHDSTVTK